MSNKISVVIPVYNGELFIARAITSVLNQSVKPYELIVVNDGSKDHTGEILATYGDTVKVVSIANGGVANARNVGIKACTGDYIAFLDADDIWYEHKLKLQLEVFERYPQVGFCCCDYAYFDEPSQTIKKHFLRFENDSNFNFDEPLKKTGFPLLLKENFVGTCSTVIFKRALTDQVGFFDASLRQSEDYDMWIKFSLVTEFVVLSAELLEKKTHETNLTNNFLETMLCHERVLINLRANSLASERLALFEDKYWSELGKLRYMIGNLFYETNQRLQAFKYYFLGLGACWTFENIKLFGYFFGRKLVRTLSFGLVKNR